MRYSRFERESVVSFVPPDGGFELVRLKAAELHARAPHPTRAAHAPPTPSLPRPAQMTYRIVDRAPSTPLYCRPSITWRTDSARATFTIGTKPMATKGGVTRSNTGGISSSPVGVAGGDAGAPAAEDVVLHVTFPSCVKSVDLSSDVGTVTIDPATNALTWVVGRMPTAKVPELSGSLYLAEATGEPLEAPHATLSFVVGGTTVSGLAVKDLLLANEKYKFFKGVKTMVRTGRFQVRC